MEELGSALRAWEEIKTLWGFGWSYYDWEGKISPFLDGTKRS